LPLLRSPAASGLRVFGLEGRDLSQRDLAALGARDTFPALESLALPQKEASSAAWAGLLRASAWRLRSLTARLSSPEALVRAIGEADSCAALRRLHLTCPGGSEEPLRDARFWPTLEECWLEGAQLDDRGARHLAGVGAAPRLRCLSLSTTSVPAEGLRAMAGSPLMASLDRLDISFSRIGPEGASALTAMPAAPLQLNLSGCGIGDRGLEALARWPGLARCRDLRLPGNDITDIGASALAASPHTAGLVGLNLHGNAITNAGATRLLAADWAARLEMLIMSNKHLTQAVAPALLSLRRGPIKELVIGLEHLPVRIQHALKHVPCLG
jgi:hypothetical protein